MKKYILSIIFIFIIIICVVISFFINTFNEYECNLNYMNTYINIKIYTDKSKIDDILNEIENIYYKYHILSDKNNFYDGITNLYTILHNKSNDEYLNIDPKLYEMISYGLTWKEKSNGKIDVSFGNVFDLWESYRKIKVGVPSSEELELAKNNSNSITLKDGKILNNHPNIYLGTIVRGFATEEVVSYLESVGIDKYIINAGGSVRVGNHYDKSSYGIGLEKPNGSGNEIYKVIYGNNISVITTGGYIDYYEYDGVRYHHIIDASTLMPSTYSKGVSVISNDAILGEMLSNILYLMPINDGIEYLKDFKDVEAIWYSKSDEIITTSGFSKYEDKKSN